LKIVALSDTHCRHHNIKLPKGDVIIHAGDVSYRGKRPEIEDFLAWFSALPYKYKIFIAGNHDFFFEKEKLKAIEELIPEGVIYLNDSGTTIDGLTVWGSPITPWFYSWAFNKPRGASINKHWQLIPPDTDIIITHGPVYGIHDVTINGQHVGCRELSKRVAEIKPKAHVCGHIHEGYGNVRREGIRYINACVLNEFYEPVNRPVVFDL
jgi:Icc-related predicted phosphoesterase